MIRFGFDDAPGLVNLSESVGWNHTLDDWRTALSAGTIFGHRAGAQIIASSAIYKYGTGLASIGQVIVRDGFRRRGLARELVVQCLDQIPAQPTMLVATAAGQPLYEDLGFRIVEPTFRLVSVGPVTPSSPLACRTMTDADLPVALALDASAYGADRSHLLRERWKHVTQAAILHDGSGFAWSTTRNAGPVIATTSESAAQLVSFLAASQSILIDIPERQAQWMDRLTQAGWRKTDSRPLMLLHASELPGRRDCVFGLTTLAYG